ncbi:MAG: site-2 protease family protein [Cyanobacteria bacterium J06560_6]
MLHYLSSSPFTFLSLAVIIIFSITLHELAHGEAAIAQGDNTPTKTGHMTLNPVVHMGWPSLVFLLIAGVAWGQMPVNPDRFREGRRGRILVAAAGPLSNLALAFISLVFYNFEKMAMTETSFLAEFWYLAAGTNLMLFFFNLLPLPPLDGFQIAKEFFPGFKAFEGSQFGLFSLMLLSILGLLEGLHILVSSILGLLT